MPALALADEHTTLCHLQVAQPETDYLATPQPSEHHRCDHRPVPVSAQGRGQRVDLVRGQDPWQRPGDLDQRDALTWPLAFPSGREAPRYQVRRDIATDVEEREQTRDARQPAADSPRGHTACLILDRLELLGQRCLAGALRGHEPGCRAPDAPAWAPCPRPRRTPSGHRPPPAPCSVGTTRQELQMVIEQRHAESNNGSTRWVTRVDQTLSDCRHAGAFPPHGSPCLSPSCARSMTVGSQPLPRP